MGILGRLFVWYLLPLLFGAAWTGRRASRATVASRLVLLVGLAVSVATQGLLADYGVYTPYAFAVGAVFGAVAILIRERDVSNVDGSRDVLWSVIRVGAAVLFVASGAGLTAHARSTDGPPIVLTFPMRSGTYLALAGSGSGGSFAVALDGAAQRFGVDLVKLDGLGFHSQRLAPAEPSAFNIFDEPVYTPCDGLVVAVEDDHPDLDVNMPDMSAPLGNFVGLHCGDATVVLSQLKKGSIKPARNASVRVGEPLARVGTSGHTEAAKLRIFAVRGKETQTMKLLTYATPVPVALGLGVMVRGDTVTR